MAALALVVVSAYLIGVKKPAVYTVIPAIFMLITTMGALIYQMIGFFGSGTAQGYLLGAVSLMLVTLAIYIAFEAKDILLFMKSNRHEISDSHPAWSEN